MMTASSKAENPGAKNEKRHVYLVDGSGFIFRAYHALPPLTNPQGVPVGAVFGFANMLAKLLQDHNPDYLAVIFDAARKNFRNDIYADYKAHRPDPPEDLIPQFGLIRDATAAFGVKAVELEGFEADDLIASYAREALAQNADVTIVSSDKDLMQLVKEGVTLFDPMKNKYMGVDAVHEKFGVAPEKVIDVQALAGDATDNVPGVPGIGPKTAAELIQTYGDLENLLAHAEEIKQPKRRALLIEHAEAARISKKLVTLDEKAPQPVALDDLKRPHPDPDVLGKFLDQNGFKSLATRFQAVKNFGTTMPATKENIASFEGVPSYHLVTDEKTLDDLIARIHYQGYVALDTETDALDVMSANLVGISLALKPFEAFYIPVGHITRGQTNLFGDEEKGDTPTQLPRDRVLAKLKPVLADEAILKIGQNMKFDAAILARYDLVVNGIDDTMLMSYVLDAGSHSHGLDELAMRYCSHQMIPFKDLVGAKKAASFAEVPLEDAKNYAAEDADITLRLWQILKARLVAEKMVTIYERIERPLIPVLMKMERAGIAVDAQKLHQLSDEFAKGLDDISAKIFAMAGEEFNIASPKQLGEILFDKMGLAAGKKTKTGSYKTDVDTMSELAAEGHEIADHILRWRQLAKLKSTYSDALVGQINPETGRVHTSFSMAVTSTGRLSSSDPNLQNIPIRSEEGRQIREAFVAAKGYRLMSIDYSQIELRLMAEIADVKALKEAFAKGLDIHAATAAQVFDLPLDKVDGETRRRAKAINFGIIYGMSAFGLAQNIHVSQSEAKEFIDTYFARYPEIQNYMERTKEFARQHGYAETIFGRRCHVPFIKDKNAGRRQFAERAAINAPLQGSAADIIKRAMIHIDEALATSNLDIRMLLQVHDELIFEVKEGQEDDAIALLRPIMEKAADPEGGLSMPLLTGIGVAQNWSEAH